MLRPGATTSAVRSNAVGAAGILVFPSSATRYRHGRRGVIRQGLAAGNAAMMISYSGRRAPARSHRLRLTRTLARVTSRCRRHAGRASRIAVFWANAANHSGSRLIKRVSAIGRRRAARHTIHVPTVHACSLGTRTAAPYAPEHPPTWPRAASIVVVNSPPTTPRTCKAGDGLPAWPRPAHRA